MISPWSSAKVYYVSRIGRVMGVTRYVYVCMRCQSAESVNKQPARPGPSAASDDEILQEWQQDRAARMFLSFTWIFDCIST